MPTFTICLEATADEQPDAADVRRAFAVYRGHDIKAIGPITVRPGNLDLSGHRTISTPIPGVVSGEGCDEALYLGPNQSASWHRVAKVRWDHTTDRIEVEWLEGPLHGERSSVPRSDVRKRVAR